MAKDDGSQEDLRPTAFKPPAAGDRGSVKSKTPPPEPPPLHSPDDNQPTEFIVPERASDDEPTDKWSPERSAHAPTEVEGTGAAQARASDPGGAGEYDSEQPERIGK